MCSEIILLCSPARAGFSAALLRGKTGSIFRAFAFVHPGSHFDWTRFNGPEMMPNPSNLLFLRNGPRELPVCFGRWIKGMDMPLQQFAKIFWFFSIEEMVRKLWRAETPLSGSPVWEYSYPVEYRDRYGYSAGPRASPVIRGGQVYIHGVTAWLTCLELETGKLVWKRI